MATKLFAAIDVGSYELAMNIMEFSDGAMKTIDQVRYRLDLGSYTYSTGKLPIEVINELCDALNSFVTIMKTYKVTDYRAYGTSAIRETKNTKLLLDQIEQRTGIRVDILSNSEQRFLDYKSLAAKGDFFTSTIENATAVLDIGGGSIQISLFDKDKLSMTQNIKLGVLRLRENLNGLSEKSSRNEELLEEMINSQLSVFSKLYLGKNKIPNLIVIDDYVSPIVARRARSESRPGAISVDRFGAFYNRLKTMNPVTLCNEYSVAMDNLPLVTISSVIIRNVINTIGATSIWCPGVALVDGIAYEYGEKKKLVTVNHDFEKDIVACAHNIAKRYMGDDKRGETLEKICMTVFDSMKKVHGLGKREKMLLRIATILHDCGKYISLYNLATCCYDIIMSTEIIGLSHEERAIVANVVKYNHEIFDYDNLESGDMDLDEDAYMSVAKLTAILRIANGLDKSQKHKFSDINASLKGDELIITVRTNKNISYEKGVFKRHAVFFQEIFSVRPVINHIAKL